VTATLDTSAVLAVVFGEPGADRVLPELAGGAISAVNIAEITAKMVDRGFDWTDARAAVNRLGSRWRHLTRPSPLQAVRCATARGRAVFHWATAPASRLRSATACAC